MINYVKSQEEANLITQVGVSIGTGGKQSLEQVIDCMAKWRWMAGVGTHNQDENEIAKELILLSKFVISNYPNLSVEEIYHAVDLSLTDKLDVDIRTFNVFSPMYVSRILNAFNEYKKKGVHEILSRKFIDDSNKETKPTPEEQRSKMLELIKYFYDEYKAKGEISDFFNTLYNYFRRSGILKPNKEVVNQALEYGKAKSSEYFNEHFMDKLSDEKPNKENIEKRYARNYCVQVFFQQRSLEAINESVLVKHFD